MNEGSVKAEGGERFFMRVFELIFYCLSTIETLSYDAGRLTARRGEKAANRRVD